MTFSICTLGCKVNYYESSAISEKLIENGFTESDFSKPCDIYIINTCAVTAESERKSSQMIRRAKKTNPNAYVIVTGCMAQISPERASLSGADYVCSNRKKLLAVTAALLHRDGSAPKAPYIAPEHSLDGAPFEDMAVSKSERTRAYIKIGDGCESKCAYCIIKDARGPIRSKPLENIIAEARTLANNGYSEIVLTAIEISAYGKDLENTDLADLIMALESVEGISRIRLGSIDPAMIKEHFVEKIRQSKKLCPHFHLSLQSGCDKTLARMRRKYNTTQVTNALSVLKNAFPSAMFTADIIVGFPGESESDFEESASFIEGLSLLHAHIFPFSVRKGTEAQRMDCQIPQEIKKERVASLSKRCESARDNMLKEHIGERFSVLFEECKDGICKGHTDSFIEVAVHSTLDLHLKTKDVILEKNINGVVFARLCE